MWHIKNPDENKTDNLSIEIRLEQYQAHILGRGFKRNETEMSAWASVMYSTAGDLLCDDAIAG